MFQSWSCKHDIIYHNAACWAGSSLKSVIVSNIDRFLKVESVDSPSSKNRVLPYYRVPFVSCLLSAVFNLQLWNSTTYPAGILQYQNIEWLHNIWVATSPYTVVMTKTFLHQCVAALALICSSVYTVSSFSQVKIICNKLHREEAYQPCRDGSVKCNLVENSLMTLTAGALAGSIGVGVAYPLDALKTKAQTYASSRDASSGTVMNCNVN